MKYTFDDIKTNKESKKERVPAKRVDIVSIKQVRERSILYSDRKLNSPEQVIDITKSFIQNSDREKFIGIFLNTRLEPTALEVISTGSVDSSIVHPREVLKTAILSNSSSMIFVHNHPSGSGGKGQKPVPSSEDIQITERLVDCGKLMGIRVLDHVIESDGKYYSFKEDGRI